jgi:hemerythrin superfamily protein
MEIYETLKQDHEELKQLLSQLVSISEDDEYRFVLIQAIRVLLVPHSRAEESVFYNTLRAVNSNKSLFRNSFKEHLEAEALLRTLQMVDRLELSWKSSALKLRDILLDHIETEETEIFKVAKKILTSEEAIMINEAFMELKSKVGKQGIVSNTMDMVINMMPPRFVDKIKEFGSEQS